MQARVVRVVLSDVPGLRHGCCCWDSKILLTCHLFCFAEKNVNWNIVPTCSNLSLEHVLHGDSAYLHKANNEV